MFSKHCTNTSYSSLPPALQRVKVSGGGGKRQPWAWGSSQNMFGLGRLVLTLGAFFLVILTQGIFFS